MVFLKLSVVASLASLCLSVTFPQTIDRLLPVVSHSLPETLLQLLMQPGVRRQGFYPIPTSIGFSGSPADSLRPPNQLRLRPISTETFGNSGLFSSHTLRQAPERLTLRQPKQLIAPTTKRLVKPSSTRSNKRRHSKQLPSKPTLEQITKASVNPYVRRERESDDSDILNKVSSKSIIKSTKKEKKHAPFPSSGGISASYGATHLPVLDHLQPQISYEGPSHHGFDDGDEQYFRSLSSGYGAPSFSPSDVHFSSSPIHATSYHHKEPKYYKPAKYDFKYVVQDKYSGNDFGHQESRKGDSTQGAYYVQLPDGRRQTVSYYVSKGTGYVAKVHYDGTAKFPPPSQYNHHGSSGSSNYGRDSGFSGSSVGGYGGGGLDNHIESFVHFPQGHDIQSSAYGGGSSDSFFSLHGDDDGQYH